MAVDTAAKRASAIHLRLPWRIAPLPDGAVGAGDRQHLAWLYSGILAGEAEPEPEPEPQPETALVPPPVGSGGWVKGEARGRTAIYPDTPRRKPKVKPGLVEEVLREAEPGEPGAVAAEALARVLDETAAKQRQKRRNKQITGLLLQLIAMED